MSEESDDIQTVNQVIFDESEFASKDWKGFVFNVVDVEDQGGTAKALDPDQIVWKDKPIKIHIDQKSTIDDLEDQNPDIKIDTSASEEKIFAQVTLEMSNLWNGMYYPEKKGKPDTPSYTQMDKRSGVAIQTWKKYLHVAKRAGLYTESIRGKRVRAPPKPTAEDLKFIADFDEWKATKPIQDWIKRFPTAEYHKNQLSLFNAMKIMVINPERLKQMATTGESMDALEKIGDLMEDERYQDPRNESNILPESAMLEDWQLPNKFQWGNKHTKGAWYWFENYGLEGKPKVWYYVRKPKNKQDAKEIANMYAKKKWSLRSWSIAPDAPDIYGHDDPKTSYQVIKTDAKGKLVPTGKYKKANVW